jgi:hypothetical protein
MGARQKIFGGRVQPRHANAHQNIDKNQNRQAWSVEMQHRHGILQQQPIAQTDHQASDDPC